MYKAFGKRALDVVLSSLALLVLLPLLTVLAVLGAVFMRGNPFFTQLRPGKIDKKTGQEKIFRLVKFRTMTNETNENGELLPDAARLCPYGRFLRAVSLDELPELLNIFIGDMSIVGPRPLLVRYLADYTAYEHYRHTVRPGLTGLSQVSGRNALSWKERFAKDREYVENVSFFLDVRIIFLTVKKVFVREGIEFKDTGTMAEYFAERDKALAAKREEVEN